MITLSLGRTGTKAEQERLARVERKLDLLLAHFGVASVEDGLAGVRELLAQGRKLEAIRLFQQTTGYDLREAKENVERIAATPMPAGRPMSMGARLGL